MNCTNCGAVLSDKSAKCDKCDGERGTKDGSTNSSVENPTTEAARNSRLKTGAFTIVASVLLLAVLGFFVMAALKPTVSSTEANESAIRYLKQSSIATTALGQIHEVGWPYGDSDHGLATLYMTVKGDKASGNYFATLKKIGSRWELVSGRIDLSNGTSVNIANPR